MTFAIIETTHAVRHIVATFGSFEAAVAHVNANFPVVYFEVDEDNAEAADFVTKFGTVYQIEAA